VQSVDGVAAGVTEAWWITAVVAVAAALLGSFAGAAASYFASVELESRRRKALSEIRRKAKVYTPIREELTALQRVIAAGQHVQHSGILLERPGYESAWPAPQLVIWREYVRDGRANTMAGPAVRTVLDAVDEDVELFNEALSMARETFAERAPLLAQEVGLEGGYPRWYESAFPSLLRSGLEGAATNRLPPHRDDPPADEEREFAAQWDGDAAVIATRKRLAEAGQALALAIAAAISELDAAMKRIAEKYEHEPD